jgi:hypothetical protein
MPLYNGTPTATSGYPFYFTPYVAGTTPSGASYTINQAGTYLLQYGLVGVPDMNLANCFYTSSGAANTALCWIGIQINRSTDPTYPKQVGAVPVGPTWTNNTMTSPSTISTWVLTGFGQIIYQLQQGDIVTLQLLLATPSAVGNLYIGPVNITYPSSPSTPIAPGPMLSITQVAALPSGS